MSRPDPIRLVIPGELSGARLDAALARLSGLSRSRIQQLLRENGVEGPESRPAARVTAGQRYTIHPPPPQPVGLEPEPIALEILFEDEHLLIVNKPAGMVVHPSKGHESGTLVHALLHHCEELPVINGEQRPGIVHRLDKDTSGSLVVAKHDAALQSLAALFARHDIDRQYLTWCRGEARWRQKRIEHPIARHPHHRQKMAVRADGRPAITEARIEADFGPFHRLRLTLHTGRTHQIRVHLAQEGLPILGDPVYARSRALPASLPDALRTRIASLPGQALHAEVLGFTHPITGERIVVRAPLPPHLKALDEALNALRNAAG
ncbi:MAG: RluA family pseudouridine synthase [Mariprofundaceae bacterium]